MHRNKYKGTRHHTFGPLSSRYARKYKTAKAKLNPIKKNELIVLMSNLARYKSNVMIEIIKPVIPPITPNNIG